MTTDEGEHHPAVEEFISGDPDELPELGGPAEAEWDPFIHGGRVGVENESSSDEGKSTEATDEGEHHPAVEEFIHGKPDELPELGPDDFGVDRPDPLFDGERIHIESGEE